MSHWKEQFPIGHARNPQASFEIFSSIQENRQPGLKL